MDTLKNFKNMLSIKFEINEQKFDASFIKLSNENNNFYELEITTPKVLSFRINSGDTLKVEILILNRFQKYNVWSVFEILIDSVSIEFNNIKIIGEVYFDDDYYEYNQRLLNHIYAYWRGNLLEPINKAQFSIEDYECYLDTTLLWYGIIESIPIKQKYVLDGSNIKNHYDFFINLGEAFVGDKGYFGNNTAALKECFVLAKFRDHLPKPIFEFKNEYLLIDILGKGYWEFLKNVFKEFGEVSN